MSPVVRFNPSPRTFQAHNPDGKWDRKPVQGVTANRPTAPAKTVLVQHPIPAQPERKIYP